MARELLRIGAAAVSEGEPFVWASGMLAPFYCDNRLTLSFPEVRRILTDGFAEKAAGLEFDCVAGVATAGIAHAALLAERLSLPLVYVRPEAKGHGHQNQIEGSLTEGTRVIMIEDLVATGLSAIQSAEAVENATGLMPVATLAIFTYKLDGVAERFAKKGSPLVTLSSFDTLLVEGLETGYWGPEMVETLREWRNSYQAWTFANWR